MPLASDLERARSSCSSLVSSQQCPFATLPAGLSLPSQVAQLCVPEDIACGLPKPHKSSTVAWKTMLQPASLHSFLGESLNTSLSHRWLQPPENLAHHSLVVGCHSRRTGTVMGSTILEGAPPLALKREQHAAPALLHPC